MQEKTKVKKYINKSVLKALIGLSAMLAAFYVDSAFALPTLAQVGSNTTSAVKIFFLAFETIAIAVGAVFFFIGLYGIFMGQEGQPKGKHIKQALGGVACAISFILLAMLTVSVTGESNGSSNIQSLDSNMNL